MTPVTTTTTNTKTTTGKTNTTTKTTTVFQKAPFRVLAALLLIEGVMIGQVLSRPGAAQTGAAEDCNQISDPEARAACWLKKTTSAKQP
ncbi:hypothetical protein [Armatimonas sp.]|uniref:hypothetical protein n=1 Tax=Armatimonas sp. TaxID=1872638 RepID=UPI00286A6950|nr:hypothetical protein [Armatimonas sp.]